MAAPNGNVTKKDIVNAISERTGMHRTEVKIIMQQFLDSIVQAVSEGKNIEIRGFGRFKAKPRKERLARNPRSGEKVLVQAGIRPVFEPSRELIKMLAESGAAAKASEILEKVAKENG